VGCARTYAAHARSHGNSRASVYHARSARAKVRTSGIQQRADEEAKKATVGRENNSAKRRLPPYLRKDTLPCSISAMKQAQIQESFERWNRLWQESPRYALATSIDPRILNGAFISLTQHLPKRHISLMLWLRTRHISLNQHLHRIGKSPSPDCPHCASTPETTQHFLLLCPQYARERHILSNTLKCNATSIPFLLSNVKATSPLIRYVNSTGRLKPTFGEVPPPTRNDKR
jgi:hypothetical protein